MKHILVLLSLLLAVSWGQEAVRNGNFEDSLQFWTRLDSNNTGSAGVAQVDVSTAYDPDPDREVCIYKYNQYSTRIYQLVEVLTTYAEFRARLKLTAAILSGTSYWAFSALTIEYRDEANQPLGRTMIIRRTSNYTLPSDPQLHAIAVADTNWNDYHFVLRDELANIPSINPDQVRKAVITLSSHSNGCTG